MENKRPLLSICIPTYNRAQCISEQLERLSALDSFVFDQIEIIISDNCSLDSTQQIVESYVDKFSFVYLRNVENIGPDANFLQCMEYASGNYIWLLGDDDYILIEHLPNLLNELEKNDYGLVHIKIPEGNFQSKEYIDCEQFLEDIGIFITFMSSNIMHHTFFQKIDLHDYIGSYFLQVPAYLISAISSRKNKMIGFPLFESGAMSNENGGYNIFRVFVVNYLKIFQDFLDRGLVSENLYYREVKVSERFILPYIYKFFIIREKHNFKIDGVRNILFKYFGSFHIIFSITLFSTKMIIKAIIKRIFEIRRVL